VAALIRLEKSRHPDDVRKMVGALARWLSPAEHASLRRAFTEFIKRVLLPGRMPGVEVPAINDLMEVEALLAERVVEWTEQWKQEGRREGLQEGRQEGRRETLTRQLQRRFGALPPWAQERVQSGSDANLDLWLDRVLDAASLEEVLTRGA
jgi:hypothetical protein